MVLSFFINSCKEEKSATKNTTLENSHYYSFKDGLLYGYEQKPNSDGSENPLIMFNMLVKEMMFIKYSILNKIII